MVGQVLAADPNGDALSFAIIGAPPGLPFLIDAATGTITLTGDLDHETQSNHQLRVQVSDAATPPGTASAIITVAVLDVNEFAVTAPVDADAAANAVSETAALGTGVGLTAFAEDLDGTGNAVTYSFTNGLQVSEDGLFAINAGSGLVTVAGALDFAQASSHDVTLRARSADGSSADADFTITVLEADGEGIPVANDDLAQLSESEADPTDSGAFAAPVMRSGNILEDDEFGSDGAGIPALVDVTYQGGIGDPAAVVRNQDSHQSFLFSRRPLDPGHRPRHRRLRLHAPGGLRARLRRQFAGDLHL